MRMETAVSAVDWRVSAHWAVVCMLGSIGADDPGPTCCIDTLKHQTLLREPRHNVVSAIVCGADRLERGGIGWGWRDFQGRTDFS